MVDGFQVRYAKIVIPFVIAAAAALTNSGCSDGVDGNSGGGGTGGSGASGGSGGEASSSSSSSSSSSTSSSSSSGMMGCGDIQTDAMNCGMCGNQCAPGQTCTAGVCTCGMTTVPFADVQTILTARCATAGCHIGAASKAGLDLSVGASYAALVNKTTTQCNGSRMRVIPGQPLESYLVDKVLGVDLCGTSKRMPPSISLSTADIQTISDWICGGALEN